MPTNQERAEKARYALYPYFEADPDELANMTDLLTDLMHYSKLADIDFESAMRMAEMHIYFEEEK
jgi:hypothetical protein